MTVNVPFDVSVAEAIDTILDAATPLPSVVLPLPSAIGRWLTNATLSRWALPSAPLSIMDGYAVHGADFEAAKRDGARTLELTLRGESAAGHPLDADLPRGAVARISTGAVLPEGADAIVPQEESLAQGTQITFDALAIDETRPGRYVRPIGSDVTEQETILPAGRRIGPGELALLASCGHHEVEVHRAPVVSLLGTGDELVPIGQTPHRGQVVSTNVPMLAIQVTAAGGEARSCGDVGDDATDLRARLASALEADFLVTTGGASVGDHDLVFAELEALGFVPAFHKVRLRPGRPTIFGHVGDTPVLVLPGNPASAHVAFELFARPFIRRLAGASREACQRPRSYAVLDAPLEAMRSRDKFDRARLRPGPPGELPRVTPLPKQLSGALSSIADYQALVVAPAGAGRLEPGTQVEIVEVDW